VAVRSRPEADDRGRAGRPRENLGRIPVPASHYPVERYADATLACRGVAPMTEPSLPEETIFAQALELESAAERAAFLDRACGDERTLRAEVEALLRADALAGDLLDLPDGVSAIDRTGTARTGAGIGPYTLRHEIGEGGFGIVFTAEHQEPV